SKKIRKQMVEENVLKSENSTAELNFYLTDFDNIKGQLKNVLEKMNKEGLIEYYRVPKAKLRVPLENTLHGKTYETSYITIDSATQERITKKTEQLKEKYKITPYESFYGNKNKIRESRKEDVDNYYEELNQFYTEGMYYTDEFGRNI